MTFDPTIAPVLFFDGTCLLCSRTVKLVTRQDKLGQFYFSPLQSAYARSGLPAAITDAGGTVVLYHQGKFYTHSAAALQTAKLLGGRWLLLYAAIIIPRPIRDAVYRWVARNRYRWFGRSNECMLPLPGWQKRFLE